MVRLRQMTADEFAKYSAFSFGNFVAEVAKSSRQSVEEIRQQVGDGPTKPSADDLWCVAEHGGEVIGFFWIHLLPGGNAFGYDIHLEESHRGKGFGRSLMLEARNLYESLGFGEVSVDAERRQHRLRIAV